LIFSGVFERFQKLRVAFAHGGGGFPFTIGRIEHAFRVRPDLVAVDNGVNPRSYLARTEADGSITPARFYVDSLVHDSDALLFLLNLLGAARIALGSDYPFPLGETCPGNLIQSSHRLSAGEKEQLLSGTAREFLGLKDAAITR
jgi:aminocarboxymuconate-semialdehyde decarboxylase